MLKFSLTVPLLRDRLFATLDTRYLSDRHLPQNTSASDFFVANLTLFSQNVVKGVELSGSIVNLFDERYGDPGSTQQRQSLIGQNGRTFWMKLKYNF
jgi:iron complex outermembrane receptor protein